MSSPADMTASWFESVLGRAGLLSGAHVTSVSLERIGAGAMSRMIRAELTYDRPEGAGPASVVVKYPTDDPGSLAITEAMGMYELEVRFYQEIAPLVPDLGKPRCYLAEIQDSSRFLLVMEDLSATTRPGDVLTTATLDDCAAALEQLVNLQAPSWNSPVLAELSWLADPSPTYRVFDGMAAGSQIFLDRFGHGLQPEHFALFEKVIPRAGEWVRSWQPPTVVQHGDFRSDNILFGTGPDAPRAFLTDFQTVRLGPPGIDPAYYLGSSLPTTERRAAEQDLIREYHHRLVTAGVRGFDFDACWRCYREGAMYGVLLFVGMAGQVESNERFDRLILDQFLRYADMAVDLEAVPAAGLE